MLDTAGQVQKFNERYRRNVPQKNRSEA
ncbi:MAG: hypothetical protein L0K70_05105 [Bifidobacterium crudilactis]|nr:hypothetical protein [Bifidobacterium crudilactis]